jgi:hypothetical protein
LTLDVILDVIVVQLLVVAVSALPVEGVLHPQPVAAVAITPLERMTVVTVTMRDAIAIVHEALMIETAR